MARTIVFTNTYSYSPSIHTRSTRRPVVPVRFVNTRGVRHSLDLVMLVDSGADTCCLPIDTAQRLGIDVSLLEKRTSRGVSGTTPTYRCEDLVMVLAGKIVRCPVHFIPGLTAFLLGREVVFDEFVFGFEQSAGHIHVRVSAME